MLPSSVSKTLVVETHKTAKQRGAVSLSCDQQFYWASVGTAEAGLDRAVNCLTLGGPLV